MLQFKGVKVVDNRRMFNEPDGNLYHIDPRVFNTVCEMYKDGKVCGSVEEFIQLQNTVNNEGGRLSKNIPGWLYLGDLEDRFPTTLISLEDGCVLFDEVTRLSLRGFKICFNIGQMMVNADVSATVLNMSTLPEFRSTVNGGFWTFFKFLQDAGVEAKYFEPVGRYTPKQKTTDKPAGCIDVNGRRINIKELCDNIVLGYKTWIPFENKYSLVELSANESANYYIFSQKDKKILIDYTDNNKTSLRHVSNYVHLKDAIKGFIGDVSQNGVKLDVLHDIIWDINVIPNTSQATQPVQQHQVAYAPIAQHPVAPRLVPKPEIPQLTAVGRFLDSNRKIVGLALSDGKQYRLDECIKLAKAGKIKNVKAISREGVNPYLQGNGISLESLPYKQG